VLGFSFLGKSPYIDHNTKALTELTARFPLFFFFRKRIAFTSLALSSVLLRHLGDPA